MNGWQRKHGICAQCSNKFYESLHVTDPDWNVWTTKRNEMSRLQNWWYDNLGLCENCESEYTKMKWACSCRHCRRVKMIAHSNLRWITRDGKEVLQQLWKDDFVWVDSCDPGSYSEWRDVPTESEDGPQIAPPANSRNIELAYIDDDGVSHFSRYTKQSKTEEYEYLTVNLNYDESFVPGWEETDRQDGIVTFRRSKR